MRSNNQQKLFPDHKQDELPTRPQRGWDPDDSDNVIISDNNHYPLMYLSAYMVLLALTLSSIKESFDPESNITMHFAAFIISSTLLCLQDSYNHSFPTHKAAIKTGTVIALGLSGVSFYRMFVASTSYMAQWLLKPIINTDTASASQYLLKDNCS